MIVSDHNISSILQNLSSKKKLAIDCETSGLRPYHGDSPFLIIIADEEQSYVWDLQADFVAVDLIYPLRKFFEEPRYWYLANAKFDMAMLALLGIELRGEIHDLQTYGKVFSLEAVAKRYGLAKDKSVDAYIKKHKLFTEVVIVGKKGKTKLLHFDQVPRELMLPYAENDARITYDIGSRQEASATAATKELCPDLTAILANERQLVKTVYDMESVGVKVDLDYCKRAAAFENGRRYSLMQEFKALAGADYVDSAKCFEPLFKGTELRRTEKGNASFDSEALGLYDHPLSDIILGIRDAKSKANYYHGFAYHADPEGIIHASFNQHQARTGRFSSSSPNLQNLKRPEEGDVAEFTPRRALVPRPGHFFAMFDYDQMEYRLLLELARADGLIAKVQGGLDVHQATAELAGVTRQQAKTTNFLTVYGGGNAILAMRLGVSVEKARAIREAIFAAVPEVERFIASVSQRAKSRGFIFNWYGRRLYFPDSETCYRATNHLVQGGCADVIKIGMNRVHAYLKTLKARLILTVHDELVVEAPESEAQALYAIREIMEKVFPSQRLPLTCGVVHSFTSLADKKKGLPP